MKYVVSLIFRETTSICSEYSHIYTDLFYNNHRIKVNRLTTLQDNNFINTA